MKATTHLDYTRLLEPWVRAADAFLYVCPDRKNLTCYGPGYNGWGVQTQQKALAALAVLATAPDLNEDAVGFSRERVLEVALSMLRFNLESHIEGSYHCMDGTSWGHTWISVLGVERMMHGVEALEPYMTAQDHALLRQVVLSECDWLLDHYDIAADPDGSSGQNKPESNLWNGSILHRAAVMYPDAHRRSEYQEKGSRFLVNSISVPSDATSAAVLDGKPVSEWFIGGNFFESFALNHHRYLNVGYMAICLSNIAMLHFTYRKLGRTAPDSLYHHVRELWSLVKRLTFPDGRLLRIGGDTRVRYCYCQDYAIPMWLLAEDLYDDAGIAGFEAGWLNIVQREMEHNGDGSYLSNRCSQLIHVSPNYYTRLESDRAVALSMGAYWRRVIPSLSRPRAAAEPALPERERVDLQWSDAFHGACFHRSSKRIAAWTWMAGEKPQGLCLPPEASDLAEWRWNMAGRIKGLGTKNEYDVLSHRETLFAGGFLTSGSVMAYSERLVTEQQVRDNLGVQHIVFAALPDDTTAAVMQYAVSDFRSYLQSVQGLFLQIPNDLFNGNERRYHHAQGSLALPGFGSEAEVVRLGSAWVNIDDKIGVHSVYGGTEWHIVRPGRRQIGIKHVDDPDKYGMLYADELCSPYRDGLYVSDPNEVLLDLGCIVRSGDVRSETQTYAETGGAVQLAMNGRDARGMLIAGANGKTYFLAANFAESEQEVAVLIHAGVALIDVPTREERFPEDDGNYRFRLAPKEAKLFEVAHGANHRP